MQTLKSKVVNGAFWRFSEQVGTQGVQLLVGCILARLVTPDEFGTVALLNIFMAVSVPLAQGGFGSALIQKRDADNTDYCSVFYFSIFISLVLYAILFLFAPVIADYFGKPVLQPIMRWSALGLIINSISGVQGAILQKNLLFNLSFRISLIQTITHGVVGVALAYLGYGVWALVFSTLAATLAATFARAFLINWLPSRVFSFRSVSILFGYSWKLVVSGVLGQFMLNLRGLVIGKVYTPADLSISGRGQQFPGLAMNLINSTITGVSFPALASIQEEKARFLAVMRRMIQFSCFLVMPLMLLLAFNARFIILTLLGPQWEGAVPFMQIACASFSLYPFHTINLQAIIALGRSDMYLWLQIIKEVLNLIVLYFTYRHGVLLMIAAGASLAPISILINSYPNSRLLGYSAFMQIRDVMPTIGICVVLSGILYVISLLIHSSWLYFIVSSVVLCTLYLVLNHVFKVKALQELLSIFQARLSRTTK